MNVDKPGSRVTSPSLKIRAAPVIAASCLFRRAAGLAGFKRQRSSALNAAAEPRTCYVGMGGSIQAWTRVLNPPYAMRLKSNGWLLGSHISFIRGSVMILAFT
jgi:hypothetical protein